MAGVERIEPKQGALGRAHITIISDDPVFLKALEPVRDRNRRAIVRSHADPLGPWLRRHAATLVICDVRDLPLADLKAFLHRWQTFPGFLLLARKPDADLSTLVASMTFAGRLDVVTWPLPPAVLQRHVSFVLHDIFVQSQLKRKARRDRMFRELADSLPVLIWRAGLDGNANYFNRVWLKFTGMPERSPTREEWDSLEHPDDVERIHRDWWHAFHTGQPFSSEFRFREAATGVYKWLWNYGMPIKDDNGNLLRWVGATIDIDEQKREADRILLLCQKLVKLDRVKDAFVQVLSQDMRAPLIDILARCDRLTQSEDFPKEDQDAVHAMCHAAADLLRIVDDLLDMSRIVRGTMKVSLHKTDLDFTVKAAIKPLEEAFSHAGVHLRTDLHGLSHPIATDRDRLQQIVRNLLSNALKFTPRGGEVRVSLVSEDACALLIVEDTGKGIAPSFLPHVFEPFSQEEQYRTRRFGGLGLGLSLVKHLVDLHGGCVRVFSEGHDKGTRVEVRIPFNHSSVTRFGGEGLLQIVQAPRKNLSLGRTLQ